MNPQQMGRPRKPAAAGAGRSRSRSRSRSRKGEPKPAPYLIIKARTKTHYKDPKTGARRRRTYRVSAKKPIAAAIDYFRSHIVSGAAIATASDGYYTWILKSGTLHAGRTLSAQEIGTLHKNLDDFTGPGSVEIAGEFKKEDARLEFNLQSGTYMKTKFNRAADPKELQAELVGRTTAAFAAIGLDAEFVPQAETLAGRPLIEAADILTDPATMAEWDAYLSATNSNRDYM